MVYVKNSSGGICIPRTRVGEPSPGIAPYCPTIRGAWLACAGSHWHRQTALLLHRWRLSWWTKRTVPHCFVPKIRSHVSEHTEFPETAQNFYSSLILDPQGSEDFEIFGRSSTTNSKQKRLNCRAQWRAFCTQTLGRDETSRGKE